MNYSISGFEKTEVRIGDLVKAYPENDQPVGNAKMEVVGIIVGVDDDENMVDVKADRFVFHTPFGNITERADGEIILCSNPNPIVTIGN